MDLLKKSELGTYRRYAVCLSQRLEMQEEHSKEPGKISKVGKWGCKVRHTHTCMQEQGEEQKFHLKDGYKKEKEETD